MKNYTLEEGLDSLNRIKLLMEYSLSKTASENALSLLEQPDSHMPFQIERFGYKQNDYKTLRPALERQKESFKSFAFLILRGNPRKINVF